MSPFHTDPAPVDTELPARLPASDEYGTYWLGSNHSSCGAIFLAMGKDAPRGPDGEPKYIASYGGERGFLMTQSALQYFASPEDAFRALRCGLARKKK